MKALDERFGRVDTVASAAKKRVEQFPAIVKGRSEQIRQYQERVSELIGVYKEHRFIHELKSQIPEIYVSNLPVRPCSQLTTAYKSAKCSQECPGARGKRLWTSTSFVYAVYHQAMV